MSRALIQLFAKPPAEGKVKTRLIPDIGVESATAVYRHCLQSNLKLVKSSSFDYQVWLTGPSSFTLFENEPVKIQRGSNLGEKMYSAISGELSMNYDKVILTGSDCLDLTTQILQKVCERLQQHNLVIIPALDGGYVLIAARQSINPVLFNGIKWGSNKVLTQTLERAMQSGIDTIVLNPLRDIDHVEDLQHYAELQQYL